VRILKGLEEVKEAKEVKDVKENARAAEWRGGRGRMAGLVALNQRTYYHMITVLVKKKL